MTTPPQTTKIEQIDDLDSVRGIGILMVFFFHATGYFKYDIPFLPSILKSFITAGHSGVTLLFVLSAFLLVQSYIKSFETGTTPSWKKFYMRRALRILPMYLIVVGASALVLKDYKSSLLALNIVWGVGGPDLYPFSPAWWAVYTEIQFYVLLPIFGYFLVHKNKKAFTAFFIVYLALYFWLFNGLNSFVSLTTFFRLTHTMLGRGFAFIIGGIASWIFIFHGEAIKNYFNKNQLTKNYGGEIALTSILLLLGTLLNIADHVGYWKMETGFPLWHILEALLWTGFVLGLLFLPLKLKPLISNVFFRQIGKISYSIYLLHYPLLVYGHMAIQKICNAMQLPVPSKKVLIMVIFMACAGASALTYRFIEKPFLEKKSKFY